jgi:peptidyl-prolyl cis-trans isomerase B (cyclophilin B)
MRKIAFLVLINLFLGNLAMQAQDQKEKQTKVKIETAYGDITLVLFNETPLHRDNFIKMVKEGWYKNSPFHRVINEFMIQGGQNADGRKDPGYTIPAEFNPKLFHRKGALAAARMPDNVNPAKASSGSQFYIVQGKKYTRKDLDLLGKRTGLGWTEKQIKTYETVGGTPFLDGSYTVFGQVIDGFDVIDKIAAVKTASQNKPVKDVLMNISIIE